MPSEHRERRSTRASHSLLFLALESVDGRLGNFCSILKRVRAYFCNDAYIEIQTVSFGKAGVLGISH